MHTIPQGLREKYERHHRVVYSPEALEAAVKLSHKYIADRHMPDKVGGWLVSGEWERPGWWVRMAMACK